MKSKLVYWTMERAIDEYWKLHLSKKENAASYRCHLKPIRATLGEYPAHKINYMDIQNFVHERKIHVKPATINRQLGIIVNIFNRLEDWRDNGIIPNVALPIKNPASKVKKFNEKPFRRKVVITPVQFASFVKHLKKEAANICWMAVLTTLRRRDLLLLTKENINIDSNQLEGVQSKTGLPYSIYITPTIKHILSQAEGIRILNFKNFNREFAKGLKGSGLTFQFRDLRRSGAREMLRSGVDYETVKEILGHADITTTQTYVPASNVDKQKATELLDSIYALQTLPT